MKRKTPFAQLDAFTRAYVTAFFFTEEPDHKQRPGEFTDWHDTEGEWNRFPVESQAKIIRECEAFRARAREIAKDEFWTLDDFAEAGRDFLFTRNGHGCGFWDGDWPTHGDALTEACKAYPTCYLERHKGRNFYR